MSIYLSWLKVTTDWGLRSLSASSWWLPTNIPIWYNIYLLNYNYVLLIFLDQPNFVRIYFLTQIGINWFYEASRNSSMTKYMFLQSNNFEFFREIILFVLLSTLENGLR